MTDTITTPTLVSWLREFARLVTENESTLTDLDAAIGDADHGANMARGMAAVVTYLDGLDDDATASAVLSKSGTTLVSTVGGASGPLYGTFFMRAGKACGEAASVDATEFGAALRAGVEGVAARGKSTTGEKTMLDALVPAVDAYEAAVADGVEAAVNAAAEAAEAGRAATVDMTATKGRASYLGERSVGHADPGATSATLLLQALRTVIGGAA